MNILYVYVELFYILYLHILIFINGNVQQTAHKIPENPAIISHGLANTSSSKPLATLHHFKGTASEDSVCVRSLQNYYGPKKERNQL